MKNKKIPKYQILRIYFSAIIMHLMLVLPVFTIIKLKNDPSILKRNTFSKEIHSPEKQNANSETTFQKDIKIYLTDNSKELNITQRDDKLSKINTLSNKILLTSIAIIFIINLPFKIYFIRKRNNKIVPPQLYKYCRDLLFKIPLINSAIFFSAFIIIHIYMIVVIQQKNSFTDPISRDLYTYYLYISSFSSLLIVLFVYLWQKHRTHFHYLEYIYNPDELRVKIFKSKIGGIRNRLWISSALTTMLPLLVVIFYLLRFCFRIL